MASGFSFALLAGLCTLAAAALPAHSEDKIATEYVLTDLSDPAGWSITSLRGNTGSSSFKEGTLTCDFSGGPGYIGIGGGVENLAGDPSEVALTFESNTSGHPIVLRLVDSGGQHFQREIARLDVQEIRTVRVPLDDMGKWYHFGGANDGVVRPPIRVAEIIVDHDGANTSVRFIKLTATTNLALPDGIIFRLSGRRLEEKQDVLLVECKSILPMAAKARYSWRVTDFWGKTLDSGEEQLSIESGQRIRKELAVTHGGVKLCEFRLDADVPVEALDGGAPKPLKPRAGGRKPVPETLQVTKTIETSVVELESPEGRSNEMLPNSPFGMGIYLGQRWPSSEMEKPAAMARSMGIKWMRDEFNWGHVEPEKGKWNFERFDASVETATRNGISIFGLLCYWAPWAKPHTEEGIRDYCSYVRRVVGRYKDRVKHWEIWNEPNIFFWTGTIEQYAELLKAAYDAVKEADPEAKVIGCCTAGTDLNFIEKVFQLGGFDKMDILSIHPYRYPHTPEESDYIGELKRADALVRKYGAPKEIWVTEIGWPTHVGANGSSEKKQAAMIVRTYIQGIASGVMQKTFWYNYRNDGLDVNYNEHNFGIIRRDHGPKPACVAFGTMTRCLEGKRFVRALDPAQGVYAHVFEGKDGAMIAAWCASGTAGLTVQGKAPALSVTDLMGTHTSIKASQGKASVSISEYPVFISGVSSHVKVSASAIKPAAAAKAVGPIKVSVLPKGPSRLTVEIRPVRQMKTASTATVRIPGYTDSFDIPAGKKAHVETYDLPQGVSLGAEKPLNVSVMVDTEAGIVTKRSNVYYVPCPRILRELDIDGRLDDWEAVEGLPYGGKEPVEDVPNAVRTPISLGKPGHVQMIETKWTGPEDLSAEIWTAWDDRNFYLAAKVRDDVFHQDRVGGAVWEGDGIQFALDPLHLESETGGYNYEIGLAQTPAGPQVYCWFAPPQSTVGGKLIPNARLAVVREGEITTYEAAIPLSALAPLKPAPDKTIGFSIILNDNDGQRRKGWLEWSSGIGREKMPSLYGDLTFTE